MATAVGQTKVVEEVSRPQAAVVVSPPGRVGRAKILRRPVVALVGRGTDTDARHVGRPARVILQVRPLLVVGRDTPVPVETVLAGPVAAGRLVARPGRQVETRPVPVAATPGTVPGLGLVVEDVG